MCLYVDERFHDMNNLEKCPHTSERPIIVWKMLDRSLSNGWVSPFCLMPYILGEVYRVELFGHRCNIIEEGLHAYYNETRANRNVTHWTFFCFPAIIPAGIQFYFGEGQHIVSKKLVVFENMGKLLAAYPDAVNINEQDYVRDGYVLDN